MKNRRTVIGIIWLVALVAVLLLHRDRLERLEENVLTLSMQLEKSLKITERVVDEMKIHREETAPAVEFTGNLQRYRDMKAKEQTE